jgi:hypothetical protein
MREPADPTSAVKQVLRAEREWLLAHLRLDVQALDRLMAPEYIQIDARGRAVSKEEVLGSFQSGGAVGTRRTATIMTSVSTGTPPSSSGAGGPETSTPANLSITRRVMLQCGSSLMGSGGW